MRPTVAVFGGGCFWCTEVVFESLKGVVSVVPGYAGGTTQDPTYQEVCSGSTGHAEVVRIEFDPSIVTYRQLLEVFFATHDPTSLNKQGNDIGTQYRSIVLYADNDQKVQAEGIISELSMAHAFRKPIVTQLLPLTTFFEAEQYHRNYFITNGDEAYCQFVIAPKLKKFKKTFSKLLKETV